jgi:hypothetical protein
MDGHTTGINIMSHNPYDQRLTNLEARYGSGLRSAYASELHSDFVQTMTERKAARYLAQKSYKRRQRFYNIFLGFSITFITAVTIGTGLIMWADALA